ncbi:MAG: hypothetical protein J0H57_26010, partial [Rhodospirillales bacterium]|nr:hypothetical protein [Rhodospirillales bacterium]
LGVGALQLMLDRGQSQDWFSTREIIVEAVLAALGIYLFIVHMLTAEKPFLAPAVFRDRNFVCCMTLMFSVQIVLMSSSALLAPYLQNLAGYPVSTAGLAMAPRGIGTAAGMFLASHLADDGILILTTPGIAIMLALCIVQIGRTPWPIATIVVLFAAAAFPNYLFTQRGPYAKEGWDYSQVADLISAHAVPGDCLLVDNTVSWRPGPIRALLATRPAAFAPLVDIERGFRGADVGALWDGHVAVWLRTAQINQCTTVWTITNRDTTLPRQQSGQALPPGPVLARTPVYRFPAQLGFRIVERWQFHYAQVIKSTR